MPSNKDRLYIAMYPSQRENTRYHYAFLIGPKIENEPAVPGIRCQAKSSHDGWEYDETALPNVRSTNKLLARLLIAKIEDKDRLLAALRHTPIEPENRNWRSSTWIAYGLAAIAEDRSCIGTSMLDWSRIEPFAVDYVSKKTEDGRYKEGQDMQAPKPTYDMLKGKETVS